MQEFLEFIAANQDELLRQTIEHLGLTFTAMVIAISLGVPAGILISRFRSLSPSVLGTTGIIQTIPSIALLGLLIPLLGIGTVPAIVALFLYALLPIVRNTFAGIVDVDASVVESARGMGMSPGQILSKVQLPLAMPVIFAGIRTATVINVGIATLAAYIGAGGLGEFIFRGIGLNNINMILAGAVPAAILALILDFILGRIQNNIRRIMKPVLGLSGVVVLAVLGFYAWSFAADPGFRAGFDPEFKERSDGYPGLQEVYELDGLHVLEMNPNLMYSAVYNNRVDVISGYTTDGRVEAYDLRILEDDMAFFPPYDLAPVVHTATLEQYPQLQQVFGALDGLIDEEKMIELNSRVDQHGEYPPQVIRDFLSDTDLPLSGTLQTGGGEITIAGKNFTEQYLMVELFAQVVERYTDLSVHRRPGLGGSRLTFQALQNHEIDVYPEYTGTALHVMLDSEDGILEQLDNDPQQVREFVERRMREDYDIQWMPALGFENTYALMMRSEHAERLGLQTITDLAEYLRQEPS